MARFARAGGRVGALRRARALHRAAGGASLPCPGSRSIKYQVSSILPAGGVRFMDRRNHLRHNTVLVQSPQVEEDEEVERAFVHIDYARRDKSEHRLDRQRFEEHTRKQEAKEAKRAARAAKRGGGNRREQGDSSGGGSGAGGAAV